MFAPRQSPGTHTPTQELDKTPQRPFALLGGQHRIISGDQGRRGDRGGGRLRPHGAQPSGGEPGARNRELRPAAIQANSYIWRRRHGGMAQSAVAVAVEPDLGWNDEQGRRLALRADHEYTSGKSTTSVLQEQQSREKSTLISLGEVFQQI